MKKETVKKTEYIWFWSSRLEYVESWLSEQAAQGWILEEIDWKGCFHFVQRRPLIRTYMFVKTLGLQATNSTLDPKVWKIMRKIRASFRDINTVAVSGPWFLVSFTPDEERSKYNECLVLRNGYLLKDATIGSIGTLALFLIGLYLAVVVFSKKDADRWMFLMYSVGFLYFNAKYLTTYILLKQQNRRLNAAAASAKTAQSSQVGNRSVYAEKIYKKMYDKAPRQIRMSLPKPEPPTEQIPTDAKNVTK